MFKRFQPRLCAAEKAAALFCAGLALAGLIPAPAVGAQLLANPGFDDGGGSLAGWGAFGNAYSEKPAFARSPLGTGKMFGNFSGGFNVTGLYQQFPAAPGQSFTLDCYSYILSSDALTGVGPPNDNWVVMKIAFFDAGNVEIGFAEQRIADGTYPQDQWIDNPAVVGVAPAGTVKVGAYLLFLQPAFAGGAVYLDDASFVPEPATLALMAAAGLLLAKRRRPGS
ncbi:MAG: hypothetical protein AMXMBFR83_30970 [Phycisphaerae bacterium]